LAVKKTYMAWPSQWKAKVNFIVQKELNRNKKLEEGQICPLSQCNNNVPNGT